MRPVPKSTWPLVLLMVLHAQLPAADWPNWRGPNHNGVVSPEKLKLLGPDGQWRIVWRGQVGIGFSSFAIAEGKLYTIGNRDEQDVVQCLDAATGRPIWEYAYPEPLDPNLYEGGPNATPTVHSGRVYTFSRKGKAFCLNAQSGEVVWEADVRQLTGANVPSWGFSSSPVVHEGLVLLNAGSHGTALDAATGKLAWQSDNSDDAGYATPIIADIDGRETALILSGKALHGVDPKSGQELWQHRWITRYGVNAADPLVSGDSIFLSSGYGKGTALVEVENQMPRELWRIRELRNQLSPGVLMGGHVYAVDGDTGSDTKLQCVHLETGEIRWSEPGLASATLIAIDDRLVILSGTGELLLAHALPEQFQTIARASVLTGRCWTPPAFANGLLYCRNAAGDVVCVDLRP